MSFQLLDLILLGIMLISGLLALMRGFTREVLSLVAWGVAAVATYFAVTNKGLIAWVTANVPYVEKEPVNMIATGGVVFLVVLIIVSLISVKISDLVIDSAAGAFDRTLGFLYGLGRGFVLVTITFLFYGWLLPADKQEPWVREATSLPYIKSAGEFLVSLMPEKVADTLTSTALQKNPPSTAEGTATGAEQQPGYQNNDAQSLDNLIEGTGQQKPAMGQSGTGEGQ